MKYSIEQTDADLLGTTAAIRYHLHFARASQHLVEVQIEIENTDEEIILIMPSWMPGSYKIRDMVSFQGNVTVADFHGSPLNFNWIAKNKLQIKAEGGDVKVNYLYYANERGVRTSHVNRFHAFLMPVACLMYVDGRQHEIHHASFYHDRSLWNSITTSLSPIKLNFEKNEPITLGALNYDVLADSPIEIGAHQVATFNAYGAIHEVAIVSNKQLDIDWLIRQVKQIVNVERDFWGELPYDRYSFILLVGEGLRGGLEHARCNVSAVSPQAFSDREAAQDMLTLLAHEYFHTWNVKRIRPVELGPFDYSAENYTSALWLAEGITSYYDNLLAYRCGFFKQDEYLQLLSANNLGRLDRVQGRFAMSVRDSSFLAWIKLYSQSPDMNNRFPSYYLKGGVIAMMLDMHIIAESDGAKRLDDAMRELWASYKNRPERGFSENEILEIIERATSVKCGDLFMSWLNSTDELPYNNILNRVGLIYNKQNAANARSSGDANNGFNLPPSHTPIFVGVTLKEDSGRLIVREVADNSPAAKAGIGIDDEIIFVNGARTHTSKSFIEAMQYAGPGNPAEIICSCDGQQYSAAIIPVADTFHEIIYDANATEKQVALRSVWLRR